MRLTEQAMELGGHWIPAGTTLQVPTFLQGMDPASFHEPEKFLPERWLGKDEVVPASNDPGIAGGKLEHDVSRQRL